MMLPVAANQIKPLTKRDYGLAFASFLITLFVFLPFARIGVDVHHDGIMLKPALDVLSGQVIFRDTFSQYGALTTYLQAMAMALFGPTLLVLKQSTVFSYALASAFLVLSWRSFLPIGLTALAYLFWLNFAPFYDRALILLPWSSVYALLFQSMAMFFLIRSLRRENSTGMEFLTGVLAAAALWCRAPVGFFLFWAVVGVYALFGVLNSRHEGPTLRLSTFRKLWQFVLGFTVITGGYIEYLSRAGALQNWYYQNFVWPAQWSGQLGMGIRFIQQRLTPYPNEGMILLAMLFLFLAPFSPLARRWPLLALDKLGSRILYGAAVMGFLIWAFWSARFVLSMLGGWASPVPVVVCSYFLVSTRHLIQVIRGTRTLDTVNIAAWAAAAVAVASWSQYVPVTCERHVFWGAAPAFGSMILVGYVFVQRRLVILTLLALLFLIPMSKDRLLIAKANLTVPYVTLTAPPTLSGMRVTKQWFAANNRIIESVEKYFHQTRGNRPIVLEGADAIYATLTSDLQNPGPLYIWWGMMRDAGFVAQREQFIREKRPLIMIEGRPRSYLMPLLTELRYTTLFDDKRILFKVMVPAESDPHANATSG